MARGKTYKWREHNTELAQRRA